MQYLIKELIKIWWEQSQIIIRIILTHIRVREPQACKILTILEI